MEIWNDVFMQYEKKADGSLMPLKKQNVDTGMGLDRTLAVLNGQKSVYDTELFDPMFQVLELDQEIMTNDEVRKARIVVDHIRASVFMVNDGVEPSNKDRGYILRRLLAPGHGYGQTFEFKTSLAGGFNRQSCHDLRRSISGFVGKIGTYFCHNFRRAKKV